MTGRRGGSGAGRGREPGPAGRRGRSGRGRRSGSGSADAGLLGPAAISRIEGDYEVRAVHPHQASKEYLCPGCQQTVRPGTGHVVAVPRHDPDGRRHWHRPCWERREFRRPGR